MKYLDKTSFTVDEVKSLRIMAKWRSDYKTGMASANLWSGNSDDADDRNFAGHYLGVTGEYAVAKYTQGFFDPMPLIVGDKHRADILMSHMGRIAVKTTKWAPPIFKITSKAEITDATHVALCLYKEPMVTIAWIIETEEFLERAYTRDFGYGQRLCLDG